METGVFQRHRESFLANLEGLMEQVGRIDESLRLVDDYMDAFQPRVSGTIRVAFVKNKDELVPELRILYRKKGGDGWFSKRVTKGWGSRSIKRSGIFEKNFETVKVLTIAAEALIAERSVLMIRLRGVTSAMRETMKGSTIRINKIETQYLQPYKAMFDQIAKSDA